MSATCARSREALDRFSAEAGAEDEMFAPAGGRVDGLDGMVAQCVLARPGLQSFRLPAPLVTVWLGSYRSSSSAVELRFSSSAARLP